MSSCKRVGKTFITLSVAIIGLAILVGCTNTQEAPSSRNPAAGSDALPPATPGGSPPIEQASASAPVAGEMSVVDAGRVVVPGGDSGKATIDLPAKSPVGESRDAFAGQSMDPVLTAMLGREVYIPSTAPVIEGQPNLHASEMTVAPLTESKSVPGYPIQSVRDPNQDMEIALTRLLYDARSAGDQPLADKGPAEELLDILLGDTRGRVYDGYPMLIYNKGAFAPDHIPGEFKMKRLTDSGDTVVSQIDGQVHKVWEVTINLLWFRQNFESDTFLLRVPYEADPYDELRINWRIYSLIQEDLAPTTILNDGFGRIFHGFDSTFTSIPAGNLCEISINYPSLKHFRGLYNWGWGNHPPRVAFLQPVTEINENGDLNPVGRSFATRNREDLTIENISEAAPEKKIYRVAQAVLDGASGAEIVAMLTVPDTAPNGTFREWLRQTDNQRQLPAEAWEVLAVEDGLDRGDFGPYDMIIAFMNNKTYGESPYSQVGTEGKGGVIRDWDQGGTVRVKVINLDNMVHYYRNVDFGAPFTDNFSDAFGNGKFSFEKFNAKPTYGVPKVAEMQWRTGWGFVPHQGIAAQSGLFPRGVDQEELSPFTDQLGQTRMGYTFKNAEGYWRFNPPKKIRAGANLPAGEPLRDADGRDGVLIGWDTEGFGVAKMPMGEITTHPDQEKFASVKFPGFLRNPGIGGDIIPPTPVWSPFLVLHPETGTLKAPDGSWWVDQTYFHGRPVKPGESITAEVEAPRASAQLFYQFDPLFHDNSVFSLHPRSDIVR